MSTEAISTNHEANDQLLRTVLRLNALFSFVSGLAFLFAAGPMGQFIGVEALLALRILGISLLPFAAFVYWVTTSAAIRPSHARIIITLDVLWVIGSLILLLGSWLPLTTAGKWFVFLQADAVATFAILQTIGLRRLRP